MVDLSDKSTAVAAVSESCAVVDNIVSHSSRTRSWDLGDIEDVLTGFGCNFKEWDSGSAYLASSLSGAVKG